MREFTQRQREVTGIKKNELMSSTKAVHLRDNSWYISLTSSANQQREMTKLGVNCLANVSHDG